MFYWNLCPQMKPIMLPPPKSKKNLLTTSLKIQRSIPSLLVPFISHSVSLCPWPAQHGGKPGCRHAGWSSVCISAFHYSCLPSFSQRFCISPFISHRLPFAFPACIGYIRGYCRVGSVSSCFTHNIEERRITRNDDIFKWRCMGKKYFSQNSGFSVHFISMATITIFGHLEVTNKSM